MIEVFRGDFFPLITGVLLLPVNAMAETSLLVFRYVRIALNSRWRYRLHQHYYLLGYSKSGVGIVDKATESKSESKSNIVYKASGHIFGGIILQNF